MIFGHHGVRPVVLLRRFMKPEKFPEIVFAKVNTEEEQGLGANFQIRSIPTLMIFREQIIIFSQAGSLPASTLEEFINKAKELDMDMVRQEIAKQQEANA